MKSLYLFLLLAFASSVAFSQNNTQPQPSGPLTGLKKAEQGDIKPGTPLMLNPDTYPMYLEDMTQLQGEDFIKYMMTNEYVPEPYLDSSKTIRAFVIRKATEEEKAFIKQMQNQQPTDMQAEKQAISGEVPSFSVTDLNGKNHTKESLKGKVVVLNFWFVECKPCIMEIPDLNHLVDKYKKNKNVVFLGIATNNEKRLREFLSTTPFKYDIVPSGIGTATSFKVGAYPTHIIIDQQSNIAHLAIGVGPDTIQQLTEKIESLLKP